MCLTIIFTLVKLAKGMLALVMQKLRSYGGKGSSSGLESEWLELKSLLKYCQMIGR